MAYSYIQWSELRQRLALRLSDTSNTFWTDAELKQWTVETLRVWGAYAAYWRERGTFPTVASTPFYRLDTQLSSLLGMTVTDQTLVQQIQYHLMEPVSATSWTGSEQFTFNDVVQAIQRRRDQFLAETGAVLTRALVNTPAPPIGRVVLADNIIDVRRCGFLDSGGDTTPLFRADEFQMNAGLPSWSVNPDTPSMYSTAVSPPLTVQLGPVPISAGQLDMLSVNTGAALDPANGATVLGVPDDFAWVVKWGALADLLGKDGLARDPDRAQYCEERWKQGCELARINPTVVNAEIQGVDAIVSDLWAIDTAIPEWQNDTGQPGNIGTAGRNMVALANLPDGIYSVTCDVVRNAVVPTADSDFIQVGREAVDVILDYAEHLAAFKMQGEEWKATNRAAMNLLRQAAQYNEKLKASVTFKEILWPTAQKYRYRQPRRLPESEPEAVPA